MVDLDSSKLCSKFRQPAQGKRTLMSAIRECHKYSRFGNQPPRPSQGLTPSLASTWSESSLMPIDGWMMMMMRTLRAEIQFEFLMANSEGCLVVVAVACAVYVVVALYAVTTIVDDFFCFAVCSLLLFSVLYFVFFFRFLLRL